MIDNFETLVLEQLRALRADMHDVKARDRTERIGLEQKKHNAIASRLEAQ